jgi:hypothetical protein
VKFPPIKLKDKVITALLSAPIVVALAMSAACAAGCPYGRTCAYPGHCPRYTDSGGDGICDLSVSSTSNTETASSSSSDGDTSSSTSTGSSGSSSNSQSQTSTNDQSTNSASDQVNNTHDADTNASAAVDHGNGLDTGNVPGDHTNYFLLPVSILLVSAYLFTHYLFSKGILKQGTHRRIWNLLLTAGYLGTGITGVILVLLINMGIRTVLNQSITFWHVELSILMVVATIIHIHLYRKPFKNIFKVLLGFKSKEKGSKSVKSRGISK